MKRMSHASRLWSGAALGLCAGLVVLATGSGHAAGALTTGVTVVSESNISPMPAVPPIVYVNNLQPSWTAPGNGGVFSGYYAPPDTNPPLHWYDPVSPGATAVYDGREAGIIKAGLIPDDGHYWDEGLFAFKPTVTIDDFAANPVNWDVINQEGTNPVWMTIEIDTGLLGDRDDNTTFQFVPASNPSGWHTVNGSVGEVWQQWLDNDGTVTGDKLSLAAIAAAHPGVPVVRAYLRLGMGDSYNGTGTGTIAWVDKVALGGLTYDFVIEPVTYVSVLSPSWDAPGGGGVFSAYVPYPGDYQVPGVVETRDGRAAGIIKAGLLGPGQYDEGLFAFKPSVTIDEFATRTLTYDVMNTKGTNSVWMTFELEVGDPFTRDDNVTFQHVPATASAPWHTVNAGASLWQQWADGEGTTLPGYFTLSQIAATYPGKAVIRTYLRLGMGDSYLGTGDGTEGWIDKITLGGQTYDFAKAQTITSSPIGSKLTTTAPFTFAASATSGLQITFSTTGPCSVGASAPAGGGSWGTLVTLSGVAGTCTIAMNQAGDAEWAPASASQPFTVNKTNQTITFPALPAMVSTDPTFYLGATASSGLPVAYQSLTNTVCSIVGPDLNQVDLLAPGTCKIKATQAGSDTYNAATPVTRSFKVKAPLAIKSVTLNPTSCIGGCGSSSGTVTLNAIAPAGGVQVSLVVTTNAAYASLSVPVVTIPAGFTTSTFKVFTQPTTTTKIATLTATLLTTGGNTLLKNLTIKAVTPLTVTLVPNPVAGGSPTTATVTLTCAAPMPTTVTFSTSNTSRTFFPAGKTMVIPTGELTGSMPINTNPGAQISVTIKATANGVTKSAVLGIQ